MTFGLVHACHHYNLPEWQAVKLTFFVLSNNNNYYSPSLHPLQEHFHNFL